MNMKDHIPGYEGEHPLFDNEFDDGTCNDAIRLDYVWGYTVLETATSISDEDRKYIMSHAASMYVEKTDTKKIGTANLEGIIKTNGDIAFLGSFSGQVYEADIETEKSREKLRFLVSEQGRGSFYIRPNDHM